MFSPNQAPTPENLQNKPVAPAKKENMFMQQAEEANPSIANLRHELTGILQRIGAIKLGNQPGTIKDLIQLETERERIVSIINNHRDKDIPRGYDNLPGGRQETIFRKLNS